MNKTDFFRGDKPDETLRRLGYLDQYQYEHYDGKSAFLLTFIFKMKMPVDIKSLQEAAQTAIRVHPQFRQHVVMKSDGLWCSYPYRSVPVFDDSNVVIQTTIGSEQTGGYGFRIGYAGCRITISVFHGVSDFHGVNLFCRTILYYYLRSLGIDLQPGHNIVTLETPWNPQEAEDSAGLADSPENDLPGTRENNSALMLLPARSLPDPHFTRHIIQIPKNEYLHFAKTHDGTPVVAFFPFISLALMEMFGSESPITAVCPVNIRPYLNTVTMHNCSTSVVLRYIAKEINMPMDTQMTITHGMLILGTEPSRLIHRLKRRQLLQTQALEAGIPFTDYHEKNISENMNTFSNKQILFINNLGVLTLPENMRAYVESVEFYSPQTVAHLQTIIYTLNDMVLQCFSKTMINTALLSVLISCFMSMVFIPILLKTPRSSAFSRLHGNKITMYDIMCSSNQTIIDHPGCYQLSLQDPYIFCSDIPAVNSAFLFHRLYDFTIYFSQKKDRHDQCSDL